MVARATLKVPRRWTSITLSQSASLILWNMPSRRMPAGLITACSPPNVSMACATMPCTAFIEVTLSELCTASPPAARISLATASAGPAEPSSAPERPAPRSLTTTLAPSRAAIRAHSRPMPLPPPVTSTTLPSRTPMAALPCSFW